MLVLSIVLAAVCGVLGWHCRRQSVALRKATVETKGLNDAYCTVAWEYEKMEIENRMRRELAHVCEDCRRHREFGGNGQKRDNRNERVNSQPSGRVHRLVNGE